MRNNIRNGPMGLWANRLMSFLAHKSISLPAYKLVSLSLCLALSLCWAIVSEAKIIERIVVIVNDDIVTQTELDERLKKEKEMRQVFYQYDEARLAAEMEKAGPEILEAMINELLFLQEAVRIGIKVSDSEMQQFVSTLVKQYGSQEALQEALKAEGYTEETFRKERKRAVLRQKLVDQEFGSELEVNDDEVRRFYRENRDKFPGKSDVVKLKHILVKFQTTEADEEDALRRAKDILRRCMDGADFSEIAKNFSDHQASKASGGDIGYFVPGMGRHDPKLEEAASKLAVGEISDIISTPGGYDIVKVTDAKDSAVRAQRIYIAVWPSQESEKHAEEKAHFILEELETGADFVDLVTKYSDDPLAVDKAGDWKEIPIDLMTPELQRAFDSFDEGAVSRAVKTPVGFRIFRIESRQDLTNEDMEKIRRFLSDQRLDEKLKEYSTKLREKAYIKKLAED
ncbi:peptidylprolyl isomerase [Candidatus Poribacteria bacterium]